MKSWGPLWVAAATFVTSPVWAGLTPVEVQEAERVSDQIVSHFPALGAQETLKRLKAIAAQHAAAQVQGRISKVEYASRVRIMEAVNVRFNRKLAEQGQSLIGRLSPQEQREWLALFLDPANRSEILREEERLRGRIGYVSWARSMSANSAVDQVLSARDSAGRQRALKAGFAGLSRMPSHATAYDYADLVNAYLLAEERSAPAAPRRPEVRNFLERLFEANADVLTHRPTFDHSEIPRQLAHFVDLFELCGSRLRDSGSKIPKPAVLYGSADAVGTLARSIVEGAAETRHTRADAVIRALASSDKLPVPARIHAREVLNRLGPRLNQNLGDFLGSCWNRWRAARGD